MTRLRKRREWAKRIALSFGVADAVEAFGYSPRTVENWLRQMRKEGQMPQDFESLYEAEKEKNEKLYAENTELKERLLDKACTDDVDKTRKKSIFGLRFDYSK